MLFLLNRRELWLVMVLLKWMEKCVDSIQDGKLGLIT
jgi:hypothetical protein